MPFLQLDSKQKKLQPGDSQHFPFLADYQANVALVAEVIRLELMNLRHSIAHTKTRAEVRGGGRKPWRQKGTGRARHGSIRSPLWVGGGATFGPRSSRNWHRKINHSARVSALKSLLADRYHDSKLIIADKLIYPKSKDALELVQMVQDQNPKIKIAVLYIGAEKNDLNGLRNIDRVALCNVGNLLVSRLANNHVLLFTNQAAEQLTTQLTK